LDYFSITDSIGVIPLRTNVGVVRNGTSCVIVDTGIDEEAGRRILKVTSSLGLMVRAIVNTHSHSDHYGGNAFIVGRTGARVYAPAGEAWVLERPWLEASYFNQGAVPFKELENKFVSGQPSAVDERILEGPFHAGSVELTAVPLPGHSFYMTGIGAESVLFCGDAVFSEENISKHGVLFLHDSDRTRESLRKLKSLPYSWFVPSHGQPCAPEALFKLVDANIAAIDSFDECVMESLDSPMSISRLESKALTAAGQRLDDPTKISLMHSTARAHISCLSRRGLIRVVPGSPGTDQEGDLVCVKA
jgi:glyoxylase-like metal-dependent hydrolase (beta-lactamase superfamily II)